MYKMLIADDERIIRESVKELIPWKELDIEICACCKNGLEALDGILDTGPDIVLTDIRMPGISGLELIEKIKGIDPQIQFVILTGYSDFEYARQALRYGVREYLLKPVSAEVIVEAVKNVKKTVLENKGSQTARLLSNLLESRSRNDREQALEYLNRYFTHFSAVKELQNAGIDVLIRLSVYFEKFSSDKLTAFGKDMLLFLTPLELKENLQKEIMKLLFEEAEVQISLSDKVKQYVQEHLEDENLSLKYIGENFLYVNVNYLSRTFTKQTGERFSGYLNRTRIEKAEKLLKQDRDNIHKIAEQVGFGSNPQYFSQVFKKYTGMTPSQYGEK